MKQLAWYIVLLISFVSCNKEKILILTDKQFEQVLFELYEADAITQIDNRALGIQDAKKELLISILDRNDVTIQQYDSTILWYSQNSDRYFKVYENILKRIDRIEQKNNKEIEKTELLALSPKGDSVFLNKEIKVVKLGRYNDSYSLSITKDKNFNNLELFRLNYNVPVLVQDTLFAELACRLKNGAIVDCADTIVQSGQHSFELTVDQEMNNVSMSLRVKSAGYINTPIWITDIQFVRVHIDSSRLNKNMK